MSVPNVNIPATEWKPGRWHSYFDGIGFTIQNGYNETIATIPAPLAHALECSRLIAAAPELLAAVECARRFARAEATTSGTQADEAAARDLQHRCELAIVAACGGQPKP